MGLPAHVLLSGRLSGPSPVQTDPSRPGTGRANHKRWNGGGFDMMTTMASADMQRSVESTAVYNKLDGIFTLKEDETTAPLNFWQNQKTQSFSASLSVWYLHTASYSATNLWIQFCTSYCSLYALHARDCCSSEVTQSYGEREVEGMKGVM